MYIPPQPPIKEPKQYLKLSEIKSQTTYRCRLTNKLVFINDSKIISVMDKDAVEGVYYDLGRYRIAEYFDYMLY